jgi:hypothetical protein
VTETMTEKKVNVKTLKNFFELKEGQRLSDFAEELKALSHEEKVQLCEGIENETFTY